MRNTRWRGRETLAQWENIFWEEMQQSWFQENTDRQDISGPHWFFIYSSIHTLLYLSILCSPFIPCLPLILFETWFWVRPWTGLFGGRQKEEYDVDSHSGAGQPLTVPLSWSGPFYLINAKRSQFYHASAWKPFPTFSSWSMGNNSSCVAGKKKNVSQRYQAQFLRVCEYSFIWPRNAIILESWDGEMIPGYPDGL